jgi:hypothetical protein
MGAIYASQFQRMMSTGLENEPFDVILEQGDGSLFNANNSARKSRPAQDWTRNTGGDETKIYVIDFDGSIQGWGEFEAASDNSSAGQFRVETNDGFGDLQNFLLFDGGDFPVTADNGQKVIPQSYPASLDMVTKGLAYVMFTGDNNISQASDSNNPGYRYRIFNGSGTELARITPGDTNHVTYAYDGNAQSFTIGGDLTFENNSGSTWQVEEIKVEETNTTYVVTQSTSISVGVADNGTITFTQIENSITGLT